MASTGVTGPSDDGVPYYAGTLTLDVGLDACGEFAFEPSEVMIHVSPIFGNLELIPMTAPLHLVVAECDCNGNQISDLEEIANGDSRDCNGNEIPDEVETGAPRCRPGRGRDPDGRSR